MWVYIVSLLRGDFMDDSFVSFPWTALFSWLAGIATCVGAIFLSDSSHTFHIVEHGHTIIRHRLCMY